jgi:diguanylate cyclase (GGDEF)-like protein
MEMLGATLDLMEVGVAILDPQSNVLFWNQAAESLTGYSARDVMSRPCPEGLYHIDPQHRGRAGAAAGAGVQTSQSNATITPCTDPRRYGDRTALLEPKLETDDDRFDGTRRPTLVTMSHRLGHSMPGMLRRVALRDSLGEPAGVALLFYPVEGVDELPHGEAGEGADIERSQADMEDRLEAAHHQWISNGMPYGLLWVTIDQAQSLRTTHGLDACEAMLRTVEQTLLRQLKPAEIIGRWGCNEYLVLAHERTAELLIEHARRLVGVARTADFRWWGDRVALTVSIGASQASEGNTLQSLLNHARHSMRASAYAGGNQTTEAKES